MVTFRQYRIPFVECGEPIVITFNTIDELLNHPWIRNWKEIPFTVFYRFSLGENNTLICESDKGNKWTILGFFDKPVDLPKWELKE